MRVCIVVKWLAITGMATIQANISEDRNLLECFYLYPGEITGLRVDNDIK